MSLRKAAIAKNQEIYTYKFDPAVHGFALLNMTVQELGAVALKDPFMAYYTTAYVTMTRASNSLHQLYQNLTSELGEINQISEYLALSEFFQTGLEPIVGVNLAFSFFYSFLTYHWWFKKAPKFDHANYGYHDYGIT